MAKTTNRRAKPSLKNVRNEMRSVRDDLKAIVAAGADTKGPLKPKQLAKAKKTRDALTAALKAATCIQSLSAY